MYFQIIVQIFTEYFVYYDMSTYKERMKDKMYWVLLDGNTVLGVFGNLKKLCDHMIDKDFPSYWTLTRKKSNKFDYKGYSVQKVKFY